MPAKILVVDDEPDLEILVNQKFRKQIRAQAYQFLFAQSGQEALEKLGCEPDIDLILSDINMPGMDGLALLAESSAIAPLTKTIMVSAYGDMQNIRLAMNQGAFDFLTKPIDFQDLEITINKTLKTVQNNKANLRLQQEQQNRLQESEAQLRQQANHLQATLAALKNTQSQLVQTEKLSSLGQLVAGVAHEINNPVNFIFGNLKHVKQYIRDLLHLLQLYRECCPSISPELEAEISRIDLPFLNEDLPKMLTSMNIGAERIRQIVLSLQSFSRVDQAEMKRVDIHEGIESTLLILQHRLKPQGEKPEIQIVKEYGDLPLVECFAGHLNQVFMNVLANAIDALEQCDLSISPRAVCGLPRKITIRTEVLSEISRVLIRIHDNAAGIGPETQNHLFEPFFTTKSVGKGTGLGLAISYQIVVEKHGGSLNCYSQANQGTEFQIEIPIQPTVFSPKALNPHAS